jgi:hypothetical protein
MKYLGAWGALIHEKKTFCRGTIFEKSEQPLQLDRLIFGIYFTKIKYLKKSQQTLQLNRLIFGTYFTKNCLLLQ